MKPTSKFLLITYPGRQWSLPNGGDVPDIVWLDGPAPSDITTKLAAADPTTLPNMRLAQIALLSAACQAQIYAGFSSSALGAAHTYPSQDTDQRNLLTAVSASIGAASGWSTSLWCAVGTTWAYTSHTAAQVAQVNADWLAFKSALQSKYADLVAQVNAAATDTAAKTRAIVW